MPDIQNTDASRTDMVALIMEAFARGGISAERRSPTEVLLRLPGGNP